MLTEPNPTRFLTFTSDTSELQTQLLTTSLEVGIAISPRAYTSPASHRSNGAASDSSELTAFIRIRSVQVQNCLTTAEFVTIKFTSISPVKRCFDIACKKLQHIPYHLSTESATTERQVNNHCMLGHSTHTPPDGSRRRTLTPTRRAVSLRSPESKPQRVHRIREIILVAQKNNNVCFDGLSLALASTNMDTHDVVVRITLTTERTRCSRRSQPRPSPSSRLPNLPHTFPAAPDTASPTSANTLDSGSAEAAKESL